MHKINRNNAPQQLVNKNITINKDLKKYDINDEWTKFTSTKLKNETMEQLGNMFQKCCAYCEGKFEDNSYAQIDHFKPKSLFPELCFDYNNMNYSCEKCNKFKSSKFDEKLINPTEDNPEEHLKFDRVYLVPLDERGAKTLEILGINNEDRLENKKKRYEDIRLKIEAVTNFLEYSYDNRDKINNLLKLMIEQNIEDLENAVNSNYNPYTTMIKHNFGNDIKYITEIWDSIIKNT